MCENFVHWRASNLLVERLNTRALTDWTKRLVSLEGTELGLVVRCMSQLRTSLPPFPWSAWEMFGVAHLGTKAGVESKGGGCEGWHSEWVKLQESPVWSQGFCECENLDHGQDLHLRAARLNKRAQTDWTKQLLSPAGSIGTRPCSEVHFAVHHGLDPVRMKWHLYRRGTGLGHYTVYGIESVNVTQLCVECGKLLQLLFHHDPSPADCSN